MLPFTIAFGLRRLRPTERHPGLIFALAIECGGEAGRVRRGRGVRHLGALPRPRRHLPARHPPWLARARPARRARRHHLALAPRPLGRGGVLLPRQFHVGVVECADEDHVRTAAGCSRCTSSRSTSSCCRSRSAASCWATPPAPPTPSCSGCRSTRGAPPLLARVPGRLLGGDRDGGGRDDRPRHHVLEPRGDAGGGGVRGPRRAPPAPLLPVRWVAAQPSSSRGVRLRARSSARSTPCPRSASSRSRPCSSSRPRCWAASGVARAGRARWRGSRAGSPRVALHARRPGDGALGWLPASLLTDGPFGLRSLRPEGLLDLQARSRVERGALVAHRQWHGVPRRVAPLPAALRGERPGRLAPGRVRRGRGASGDGRTTARGRGREARPGSGAPRALPRRRGRRTAGGRLPREGDLGAGRDALRPAAGRPAGGGRDGARGRHRHARCARGGAAGSASSRRRSPGRSRPPTRTSWPP